MDWIGVANVQDVGKGKLRLVEAQGKKIVVANVDDRFYSFNDRCPHMNSPLHLGTLQGKVVTCPLHFATYDVTTGKKLSEPKMDMPRDLMQKLPADFIQMYGKMGELMSHIETLNLEIYATKTEANRIFVKI